MLIPKKDILETLSSIPELPGCYRYLDKNEDVIYIGKAKSLRRRIASYFQKEHSDAKTRALVNTLQWLEYFVVDTEHDALLLEYNLIKEYRPRYNIMLKNGNFYPYICVKREPFPRVFITHKPVRDGSEYFGPYPAGKMAHTLVGVIKKVFLPRTCSLNLTQENIALGRFRVCLNYHIHRCLAPCVGKQSEADYDENIRQIREVLKGNISSVKQELSDRMMLYASELKFEEAQAIKHSISILESYQAASAVISHSVGDALVCSFSEDLGSIYLNYLEVRSGNIVSGETLEYKKSLSEEPEEWLSTLVQESLNALRPGIKELILPLPIAYVPEGITVTIPQRGDKKRLLELSQKNVEQYKTDRDRQAEKLNPEQRNMQLLQELQNALGLPGLPYHMECFDNSNIQGSSPVAACVAFIGGRPAKELYRHYHIRSVQGQDDYASMAEAVQRRYTAFIEEDRELPDLIIADGGKGHMETIRKTLEDMGLAIPILGLAKDRKHKTANILYGNPPEVVGIMQRSPVFLLLERVQNEVHRFAIKFHREVRSKSQTHSELDTIHGIGSASKAKLLKHFKSVKKIREASLEDIEIILGRAKARLVHEYFHTKSNE